MLATSSRFLAAVRESHRVTVRATLLPPGADPVSSPVIGGQLVADMNARMRRQASLTIPFDLARDADTVRLLAFGGYVKLERGITYASGEEELLTIGVLRINAVSWNGLQGEATFDLSDRMAQVADEQFLTPWVPVGLKPSDAIVQAVQQVFGSSITYTVTTTPASEPALVDTIFEDSRDSAVFDLAASIGASAYFDALGNFILRPTPSGSGVPDWTLDAGPRGSLIEVTESLDRSAVRNGVAVRGQAAADTAPIFALATDTDPASPTLWGGPFGRVPLIVRLTSVQTQAQADSTAASLLNLRLGLARTLTLRGLPNPALEPGDRIGIVYPDGRSETVVLNSIVIPLDPERPVELTASGHYVAPSVAEGRVRVFQGAAAWRELEGVSA